MDGFSFPRKTFFCLERIPPAEQSLSKPTHVRADRSCTVWRIMMIWSIRRGGGAYETKKSCNG